jgi:uncharacterized protein (DUF2141 family)
LIKKAVLLDYFFIFVAMLDKIKQKIKQQPFFFLLLGASTFLFLYSCANIGYPDGGAYDEMPPRVIGSVPVMGSLNNDVSKIVIQFDEYIKLEKASEKVVVSPPQIQKPEVKANGKKVVVKLQDSLRANTTYTIDFSDAIVDNNEGNPLGNFTFTFATGAVIDTMEVSGYVIDASNLEPVKNMLVGLHENTADSAFNKLPFVRVSRTDSRGHFSIRGVKKGNYRVYALNDVNQNFRFDQKSEMIAYQDSAIFTRQEWRTRMDTMWVDTLTIDTIVQRRYVHYSPDSLLLYAFTEDAGFQYLERSKRSRKEMFNLRFAKKMKQMPQIKGVNFKAEDAFLIEKTMHNDTLQYWLKDSLIYNLDTLKLEVNYQMTDTLGNLVPRTDTLSLTYKKKRVIKKKKKKKEKEIKIDFLKVDADIPAKLDVYASPSFTFAEPILPVDTTKIHLSHQVDTLWQPVPFQWEKDSLNVRKYRLFAAWKPGEKYKIEADSMAFTSFYGKFTTTLSEKFTVHSLDDYSALFFNIKGLKTPAVVELLNSSGKPIRQVKVKEGQADFYYLKPGTYYARLYEDANENEKWDTGNFEEQIQPERMYYYPQGIKLKVMFEVTQDWDLHAVPLLKQKPEKIVKQKPDRKKRKSRNAERNKNKR